jgi:hypothetical protein
VNGNMQSVREGKDDDDEIANDDEIATVITLWFADICSLWVTGWFF